MKRHGIEWVKGEDYDQEWSGIIDGRFCLMTWKFGSIHQCVVDVKYKASHTRICLECQKTCDAAMLHALDWFKNYSGPKSPEETIRDCFDHWPDLYPTRLSVLDSMLVGSGGDHEWLDGGVICTRPEDWLREKPAVKLPDNMLRRLAETLSEKGGEDKKFTETILKELNEMEEKFTPRDPKDLPFPDNGEPYEFYNISSYSNINNIPATCINTRLDGTTIFRGEQILIWVETHREHIDICNI